uniref:Perlucin n=1 Tax=Sinohyriopsis cumingii TaxID=165450 RepID=M9QW24_SINCU|nr:perlucin [Sinohyriopsis cumingii]
MDFSLIFVTVAIFVTAHVDGYAVQHGRCPLTFERHGRQCYKVIAVQASWSEAKEYCQVIGGDLAKIRSASDQTIIYGLVFHNHGIISNERYWVDGSDMLQSGMWRWMGTNGASVPFSYTNWYPGQPSHKNENCAEVMWALNGRWNDLDCTIRQSFICQARS